VIDLDHIVQIFDLAELHHVRQLPILLEFANRYAIGRCFVRIDRLWPFPVFQTVYGLAQKMFGSFGVPGKGR